MLDDKFLLRHSSIDAYLFLRFLRLIVVICVAGCCLTWPVLFAVNATAGGGATQLDRIAIGNIENPRKLYAHAIIAMAFLGKQPVIPASGCSNVSQASLWCLSRENGCSLSTYDKHMHLQSQLPLDSPLALCSFWEYLRMHWTPTR